MKANAEKLQQDLERLEKLEKEQNSNDDKTIPEVVANDENTPKENNDDTMNNGNNVLNSDKEKADDNMSNGLSDDLS